NEFFCAVIVENDDGIIASGLAYTRAMRQGSYNFTAAIIGNVAVKSSYRGQGLSKVVIGQLEQALAPTDVAYSFLFAYETNVYQSSGYSQLESPIRYFDTQKQNWNQFVYRGGMYKAHTSKRTLNQKVIEFGGCVY
uniref:GNAT family N-acetyltransferase n=1 Tax=Vibrio variabilis TaxID=990271 RepID=UPI0013A6A2E7